MKIALTGPIEDVKVIKELLSPWDVTFTGLDESDIVIVYKQKPPKSKKAIVIPSNSKEFWTWTKNHHVKINMYSGGRKVCIQTSEIVLTVKPRILYSYRDVSLETLKVASVKIGNDENFLFLKVDVVSDYTEFLNETLNAEQSKLYKLFTGLPLPYGIAPKQIRDFFMKSPEVNSELTFCDKLQIDALRMILVEAINELSGKGLQKRKWTGQSFACVMTHDVENYDGLERALEVKKLEEKYNVPSAWFIPSKRYELKDGIVKTLTNYGEVGAHDTKHDGKLAALSKNQLINRLIEVKQTLKTKAETQIDGFRAPLLQHNFRIIEALKASGYVYDASIPSWEPKHPYTMKPHGIGTVFPFHINSLAEIPLTLPQDHQMLHALGLTPQQTVEVWTKLSTEIKSMGGLCVFLAHPNELANKKNEKAYEELLTTITSYKDADFTLPITLADFL